MNLTFTLSLMAAAAKASHPTSYAYYPRAGQPQAPYPIPGHHGGHGHHAPQNDYLNYNRNPWSFTSTTFSGRESWYSPYQQYSPMIKRY